MIDRVQCSGCGADRPTQLPTGRSPCPNCGETALTISLSTLDAVAISDEGMVVELTPPFEERDWRHRWERLREHEGILSKPRTQPFTGPSIQAARHELHWFFIQAYHLKDALKNDAIALRLNPRDVEEAINASPALALAADLANFDKHGVFKKGYKPRSGHTPRTVGVSGMSITGEWRLNLTIQHGSRQVDGISLAAEIIKQWADVLSKFGLV